jgi:3-hydroxyisobutyrate dehydrogenase-like beta-hydroxyacid dehydrogenase
MKMETVAILSTGEMGHSVASVLKDHGLKVVTCLAGRSERTAGLAAKAGVISLPALKDVVAQSDLIISIVVPSVVKTLAQTIAAILAEESKPVLFADANAISAIISTVSQVGKGTMFYVSGPSASEFAELKNFGLKIEILGDQAGQASAFKIVYAGLTKGISALTAELFILAHALGIRDQIMEVYRAKFPDVMRFAEANLPRLPFRAGRRSDEMEELSRTIEEAGLTPLMALASQQFLASIGELNLRAEYSDADEEKWDVQTVLKLLHERLYRKDAPVE